MKSTIIDEIKRMPKIELHFHFEGAFRINSLWILSNKYNPDVSYEHFKSIFNVFDFLSFIQAWEYKNSLIRTLDDLSFLCDDVIKYLQEENIIYTEITISPFGLKHLNPRDVIALLYTKFLKSKIDFIFIGDIVRNTELSAAYKKYHIYKEMKNYGIKAIGLGGDEENYDSTLFKELFKEIKQNDFGITIHAGEYNNENNIKNSILYCYADRIGHGNNIKNVNLIRMIKDKNIHIEMCPLSNKRLNKSFEIKEYCFYDYLKNNMNVSINSDDPGIFSQTLSDNYLFIVETYDFNVSDLQKIQANTVKSCFCDDEKKLDLLKRV